MFPFPIAKPQKCDIQTFYNASVSGANMSMMWNKPVGVSHVYMMLIGGGGNGDGTNGGGSGAVTVWFGAAQHVPNNLQIIVGGSQEGSEVKLFSRSTPVRLLLANGGQLNAGATATAAGPFAASGFYKSTAGQNGSGGDPGASSTTFLSGGGDFNGVTSNYGYSNTGAGFFQMQPIIVGGGGDSGNGGIGCGGSSFGVGGAGMVLIASW